MMRGLDVDVVILSWNRPQMTLEAVRNVLAQRCVNPQVWIVDQGSTPENIQLLRRSVTEHPNLHLVELHRNVGVPAGRNIGMKLGEAEYIVSIDNDAVFESSYALNSAVNRLRKEPRTGAIGFRIKNYYTRQDDELLWAYPKPQKAMRHREFWTTRFPGAGHALRRSVVNEAEGYDDNLFFYWEEVDLSYKIINLGYKIVYDPTIVILHKVSPEKRISWKSGRFYFLVRNAIYLRLKYGENIVGVSIVALGYITKGFYNLLPRQALKGVVDAVGMYYRASPDLRRRPLKLSDEARSYIRENETRYRGSLWNRLRNEVFAELPKGS